MKRWGALMLLIGILALAAGCDRINWQTKSEDAGADLIYVQVVFDNGDKIDTYVKEMGIGKDSTVYAGGNTNSAMYDARGNLIGSFNYSRVHYMKVLAPAPQ